MKGQFRTIFPKVKKTLRVAPHYYLFPGNLHSSRTFLPCLPFLFFLPRFTHALFACFLSFGLFQLVFFSPSFLSQSLIHCFMSCSPLWYTLPLPYAPSPFSLVFFRILSFISQPSSLSSSLISFLPSPLPFGALYPFYIFAVSVFFLLFFPSFPSPFLSPSHISHLFSSLLFQALSLNIPYSSVPPPIAFVPLPPPTFLSFSFLLLFFRPLPFITISFLSSHIPSFPRLHVCLASVPFLSSLCFPLSRFPFLWILFFLSLSLFSSPHFPPVFFSRVSLLLLLIFSLSSLHQFSLQSIYSIPSAQLSSPLFPSLILPSVLPLSQDLPSSALSARYYPPYPFKRKSSFPFMRNFPAAVTSSLLHPVAGVPLSSSGNPDQRIPWMSSNYFSRSS